MLSGLDPGEGGRRPALRPVRHEEPLIRPVVVLDGMLSALDGPPGIEKVQQRFFGPLAGRCCSWLPGKTSPTKRSPRPSRFQSGRCGPVRDGQAGRSTCLPGNDSSVPVRASSPSCHTPIFGPSEMSVFMEPTSPKRRALEVRGCSALHNGVPDNVGSGGEFQVSGRGLPVADINAWSRIAASASYAPVDRFILFELLVSEACHSAELYGPDV